jgi:UDP-glucose 4-epimerase
VARANICALKADVTDACYNVGSGVQTSIKDLAQSILEITGSNLEIYFEPAGETFVTNRIGDPTRAEKETGFKYTIEIKEGLRKLVEWRDKHKTLVEQRRNK